MTNELLSDDVAVLCRAVGKAIAADVLNPKKVKARQGIDYYNYKNDILKSRIFYFDGNGELREDKYASNVKIPHAFFPELVDQLVQYLLSNPIEFECGEDETFREHLEEYYDEDFQLLLHDLVTNGCQKGFEYPYARTTAENRLKFQIADGLKVIPVYDGNNDIKRYLRYYSDKIVKGGKLVIVKYAELYDENKVWYFVATEKGAYKLDQSKEVNPAPSVLAKNEKGELGGRGYGFLPFYRYKNNQSERTDLEPIKALIDDYDAIDAGFSNNLADFTDAYYVVKGYEGDNLDTLKQNLRTKKTVGVSAEGGVDIKTIDIPVEARKAKMEIDRENIYRFGKGFDSSQVGDGNVTNVVIKGRYTLLNMKANKVEVRLRAFLKWANELVVKDINRLNSKNYDPKDVKFIITREMLVNENDIVTNEKTEADTRLVNINAVLAAAPKLDDDTVLQLICEQFELDYEEVKAMINETGYSDVAEGTDPIDTEPKD
ncbi:phage portal protein [Bacillus cereus]|nr:phage portal protein [Bacillus cereus]